MIESRLVCRYKEPLSHDLHCIYTTSMYYRSVSIKMEMLTRRRHLSIYFTERNPVLTCKQEISFLPINKRSITFTGNNKMIWHYTFDIVSIRQIISITSMPIHNGTLHEIHFFLKILHLSNKLS
jgi:hypothetical protein